MKPSSVVFLQVQEVSSGLSVESFGLERSLAILGWLVGVRGSQLSIMLDKVPYYKKIFIFIFRYFPKNCKFSRKILFSKTNFEILPKRSRNSAAVAIERVSRDLFPPGETSATFTNLKALLIFYIFLFFQTRLLKYVTLTKVNSLTCHGRFSLRPSKTACFE